jgi:hypothetical protein
MYVCVYIYIHARMVLGNLVNIIKKSMFTTFRMYAILK